MTDEERKISVVTNAIAYAVESYKPSRGVSDVGPIYIGDMKTEMYSAVAKHVLWTLKEYERQQLERGTKV